MELQEFIEFQEAPAQLREAHVHLVAEVDQQIRRLALTRSTLMERRAM